MFSKEKIHGARKTSSGAVGSQGGHGKSASGKVAQAEINKEERGERSSKSEQYVQRSCGWHREQNALKEATVASSEEQR